MKKNTLKPHITSVQDARAFLEKIVIDAGIGRQSQLPSFEEKVLPQIIRDLAAVTGQKPELRRAKKSIAGFKIREGQIIGLRVTLRKKRMVDFFERLIRIVMPRVRDFRGVDVHVIDAGGTLNLGIKEQVVFPEINPEQSPISFSIGVSIVPKDRRRAKAIETFRAFGFPLKK